MGRHSSSDQKRVGVDPLSFLHAGEELAKYAREDFNTFCETVLRDEKSGRLVVQSSIHREWVKERKASKRLVLWSAVESGKSQQNSIALPLWELGRDPTIRVALISNTHTFAEKLSGLIKRYVEMSDDYHRVFPNIKPGYPWTSSQLNVSGHDNAKDPNLQICGIHGSITGSRLDLVVLDDVLDYENCRTERGRQDVINWYLSAVVGRLTEDSRVVCIGTAYHPEDFMHWLARQSGFRARRFPAVDANGNSAWSSRWSQARIEAKRAELGELEFSRQMMCLARDDSSSRFKEAWIEVATRAGFERQPALRIDHLPPGYRTYTGVDLGVMPDAKNDETAIITILVYPNETREILEVIAGHWAGPEIVGRIIDCHNRFQSQVMVETNAAQAYIVQFVQSQSAVPVHSFQTNARSKFSPEFGVESLAVEMAGGKWVIPSPDGKRGWTEQVDKLIREMLYYDPAAHTGDRLIALWLAREAARRGTQTVKRVKGHVSFR